MRTRQRNSNGKCNCLICENEFTGEKALREHLSQYISFKVRLPFPCGSCHLAFNTPEARNAHCNKEGHLNTFDTIRNPNKEMILEHLVFDAQQARNVGCDILITEKNNIFLSALNQLKAGNGKVCKCILCNEDVEDNALHMHIKQHIHYKPYACECKERFYTEDARRQHAIETKHCEDEDARKKNKYCEMLVKHFLVESRSMVPVEELRRCKAQAHRELQQRISNLPPQRVRNVQNRQSNSQSQQPRQQAVPVVLDIDANRSSSSCEPDDNSRRNGENGVVAISNARQIKTEISDPQDESGFASSSSTPSTPALNLSTHNAPHVVEAEQLQHIPSNDDQNASSFPTISELRTSPGPESKCRSCNKMVDSDFLQRQKHVAERHMTHHHSDSDYTDLLEAEMKKAFPGESFSSNLCQLCFKGKCTTSNSRRGHVMKQHSHLLPVLNCPSCNQRYFDAGELRSHWRGDHNDGMDFDGAIKKLYDECRTNYNIELDKLVGKAYPASIIKVSQVACAADAALPLPKTSIIAIMNRIPKPSECRTRRRRDSDSSDSDSESEMEFQIKQRGRNTTISSMTVEQDARDVAERDRPESIVVAPTVCNPPPPHTSLPIIKQEMIRPSLSLTADSSNVTNIARRPVKSEPEVSRRVDVDDDDDEITILRECAGDRPTTSSSPADTSRIHESYYNAVYPKRSRLSNEVNEDVKAVQPYHRSRWDQRDKSAASPSKLASHAKVRRYEYYE